MGYLGLTFTAMAAAWAILCVLILLAGKPLRLPEVGVPLLGGMTGATIGCAIIVRMWRKRPPWVRIGPHGIELAGARGDAVFVAWPLVASTRIRWRGYFARLEVTVTDPTQVGWTSRGARQVPQIHRKGAVSYWVDIGAMRGGPQRLETLLREPRGPAHRTP